jgi:ferrous iron transport protein A
MYMEIISLDMVREGSRVIVVEVGSYGWSRRLYQMGIVPGSKLEVVFNKGVGPVVVRVGDTEVSIGRGIAKKILVKVDSS